MPEQFPDMQQKPKKHSLFKHKEPSTPPSPISTELSGAISRLRVLEERYTNLEVATKITEENMVRKNKTLTTEIKTLTPEINELKREIEEIKDKILLIIKELQTFAKKEDVKVLQRYIDMWQPLNFVTHEELQEVMKENK